MNRNLKSIAYAFIARDIDIYIPDGENDCILVTKLVCSDCGEYWHTSLSECYFCGDLNYYLYKCDDCCTRYSITNASRKCGKCHSTKISKVCMNPNCISNTDEEIKAATLKKGGVFDLGSSFNISLNHCVGCGGKKNEYKVYRIYVYNYEAEAEDITKLKAYGLEKLNQNTDLVLVKKKNNKGISYNYYTLDALSNLSKINFTFDNLDKLIESLYPII